MQSWPRIILVALLSCAGALAQSVRMPDGEVAPISDTQPPQALLKDGTRLIGVDMRWYTSATPDEQPLIEDDEAQIRQILTVPSFYDKTVLLHLEGDAQRAVGLVELIRDRDFHAGRGEVVWRMEIWYFEFLNGGWAKVSQQNKVIDRQRFRTREEYQNYVGKRRFVPRLVSEPTTRPATLELKQSDLILPTIAR